MDKIRPPHNLRESIILGIAKEERSRALTYLGLSSIAFVASAAGLASSVKYLIESLYQSGFSEYLSILFAVDATALRYSKELAYSIIETMPTVGIIGFLTALGFFIWSGVNTLANARRAVLLAN